MNLFRIIQGAALAAVLVCASVSDIRRHEVDNWVWTVIVLLGLIGIHTGNAAHPLSMLFGAAAILSILVPLTILQGDKGIGGADIKISAAAGFLLGGLNGLYALSIGLLLAVLAVPIDRRISGKAQNTPFPLVPFLSAGIMTAFLF